MDELNIVGRVVKSVSVEHDGYGRPWIRLSFDGDDQPELVIMAIQNKDDIYLAHREHGYVLQEMIVKKAE